MYNNLPIHSEFSVTLRMHQMSEQFSSLNRWRRGFQVLAVQPYFFQEQGCIDADLQEIYRVIKVRNIAWPFHNRFLYAINEQSWSINKGNSFGFDCQRWQKNICGARPSLRTMDLVYAAINTCTVTLKKMSRTGQNSHGSRGISMQSAKTAWRCKE